MSELGLALPDDLLAIVCASHDGCDVHTAAVEHVLDQFELTEADLRNTPSLPYNAAAATRPSARAGALVDRAELLGQARRDAGHLQDQRLVVGRLPRARSSAAGGDHRVVRSPGSSVHHVGVDGCGAPTHAIGLVDLARHSPRSPRCAPTWPSSMTARPDLVGGPTRDVTVWMQAIPGLVAKDGADGVMAGALPDGRASR